MKHALFKRLGIRVWFFTFSGALHSCAVRVRRGCLAGVRVCTTVDHILKRCSQPSLRLNGRLPAIRFFINKHSYGGGVLTNNARNLISCFLLCQRCLTFCIYWCGICCFFTSNWAIKNSNTFPFWAFISLETRP